MAETLNKLDSLLHDVLYAAKLTRDRMGTTLRALGLHRGQGHVLQIVAHNEGIVQCDLAEAIHVTPATLSATLHRMETAEIIERRSDPDDDRLSRVYLSTKGREIAAEVQRNAKLINAELERGFRPEEIILFRRFLKDLHEHLRHHPPS